MSPVQAEDLYLLGGNDGQEWLDVVDVLSPDIRQWRSGASLPSARGYGAAAAIGHHLFMVGGGNGAAWLSTTIMLDPTHGWQQVREMAGSLRMVFTASCLPGSRGRMVPLMSTLPLPLWVLWLRQVIDSVCMYCLSRDADISQVLVLPVNLRCFTAEHLELSRVPMQMASMRAVRGSLGAVCRGGRIWAIGGGEPGVSLETVEVYDPTINTWMPGASHNGYMKQGWHFVLGA